MKLQATERIIQFSIATTAWIAVGEFDRKNGKNRPLNESEIRDAETRWVCYEVSELENSQSLVQNRDSTEDNENQVSLDASWRLNLSDGKNQSLNQTEIKNFRLLWWCLSTQ